MKTANILLVHAHEESRSFNGAMRDLALSVLTEAGHRVDLSDLYAMNFNPVGGKHDFLQLSDPSNFKYGIEQTKASADGTFCHELAAEHEKLMRADLLIFQFPLWWFGMPAILKGWVDRVFAAGLTYGGGRWYSNGVFKGRRAMISVTTGGPEGLYHPRGVNGDIKTILFPIQHGILYFTGFDVLPPYIVYGPAKMSSHEREAALWEYRDRLLAWETTEPISYPSLDDYDERLQLKDGV